MDEESALVQRKLIRSGEKFIDMISEDHVWAVVVTSASQENYDPENELMLPPNENSHILVNRYSSAALKANLSTILIWAPEQYISLSQRAMVQSAKGDTVDDELKAKVNIQIFDVKA